MVNATRSRQSNAKNFVQQMLKTVKTDMLI